MIVNRAANGGSYSLRLQARKPAEAAKIAILPTIRYQSARITELTNDLKDGKRDAVARFWSDAAVAKGPLVEPFAGDDQYVLATFVWREMHETHHVKLVRPPASKTSMDYYLTHLPGTDVWYKTMKVHRTSRFGYAFFPNNFPAESDLSSVADPLNPHLFPGNIDQSDWTPSSIFELPDAPDLRWSTRTPARRGSVVSRSFDSPLLKTHLNVQIYTPPDYAPARGPYPVAVIFDGPAYTSDIVAAPTTLDNLIGADKIRPPIVCFVSSETNAAGRAANLGRNPTFAAAIATELMPWLRSSFAISAAATDAIVGGFSAGAGAGFFIAALHPEVFGNVLAQDGGGDPRLLQMYMDSPKLPLRFYMDQGMYETPDMSLDELGLMRDALAGPVRMRDILLAKGYDVTYRATGTDHEWLHVRATLGEALVALLGRRDFPAR